MSRLIFITLETLLEMKENNDDFVLVEVLGPESYANGHIPGAVNIPVPKDMTLEQLTEEAEKEGVTKDRTVVTYCASYTCVASTRAGKLFLDAGFGKVLDFKASKKGWADAGFELER